MKPEITLALIGALGLMTGAALAQLPPDRDQAPTGAPEGRPNAELHRQFLLEKYDANKNGKLDETEFAALGKDLFEGKLRPPGRGPNHPGNRGPEFGPPDQDARPGFGPPPRGPRGGDERAMSPRRHGRMGDGFNNERHFDGPPMGREPHRFGPPDSEEGRKLMEEHRREFLKKYDADNDGKLDSAEREAIGKDIEDGKLPPPPPFRPRNQDGPPAEQ